METKDFNHDGLQNDTDSNPGKTGKNKVSLDNLTDEWLPPRLKRICDKIEFETEWHLNDNYLKLSFKNRKLNFESSIGLGVFFLIFGATPLVLQFV